MITFLITLIENKIFIVSITILFCSLLIYNSKKYKVKLSFNKNKTQTQKANDNSEELENKNDLEGLERITQNFQEQAGRAIDLLNENFKDYPTRELRKNSSLTPVNTFLGTELDGNIKRSKECEKTFNRDMLNEINNEAMLEEKIGAEIAPFMKRIDENGKIVLSFQSIDFITSKHAPLIMPDGTIRCMNVLSLEAELLLSIEKNKVIFYLDEKGKLKRITPEQSKLLVANIDDITLRKDNEKLKEQNIKLGIGFDEKVSAVIDLNEINLKLKEENKKLKIAVDIYKSALNGREKEIAILPDVPNKKHEVFKEMVSPVEDNKENNNCRKNIPKVEIQKEDLQENLTHAMEEKNISEPVETASSINNSKTIDHENNKKRITLRMGNSSIKVKEEQPNEPEQSVKKIKINDKNLKKIKEHFLSEFELLSNENTNTSKKNINDLVLVSMKEIPKEKSYELYFNEKKVKEKLRNYINLNNYEAVETENIMLDKLNFIKCCDYYFFDNKNLSNIYKGTVRRILIKEEDLFGMTNKDKFSQCLSLKEIIDEKNGAIQAAKKDALTLLVKSIDLKEYSEVFR